MKVVKESQEYVAETRTGKEKWWKCMVLADGTDWYTQTSYWQVNKKGEKSVVQSSDPYKVEPKNVGRSNETTAEEQALLEWERAITKQTDKGYHLPGEEPDILPLPMLAKKYEKRMDKVEFPVYVQPKLNGQRMLFDGDRGWSRGGKEIIPEVIQHLRCDTEGLILDGELILPDNQLLQETMKAVKKFRPELSPQLLYVVYDVVEEGMNFGDRHTKLSDWWSQHVEGRTDLNIIHVMTHVCTSHKEISERHTQYTQDGYEGTMVRDPSGEGYRIGHRSNQLLKVKDFVDSEFKIVDVVEGGGRFKGAAIFVCETEDGNQFNCTPEGSMDHRRSLYENRDSHINKYLTIRYQELSNDGIPLFPVGVGVRETKEGGY